MAGVSSILELLHNVDDFQNDLKEGDIIREIIYENETFIINMNADDQLFDQGVNSLGIHIDDYAPYSEITIQIKQEKGQPTNRVTLHDEGDFANSIFLQVGKEQFEIKASDAKTQALIRKYGHQILGLTNENLKELIWEYIYPELQKQARRYIYAR